MAGMRTLNRRASIARILRWAVSAALLVLLFRMVELQALKDALEQTNLALLLVAFIMLLADRFFFGLRWRMILQPYTTRVSLGTLVRITFISTFIANFLPSALSADLVRGYFLYKENANMEVVVSTVMLDRLLGFVAQLLLALVAMAIAYFQGFLPEDWLLIVPILFGMTVLGVGGDGNAVGRRSDQPPANVNLEWCA
jgi:uncharacterized protein (TIRG00374 family)